jgi:hypothetical protein
MENIKKNIIFFLKGLPISILIIGTVYFTLTNLRDIVINHTDSEIQIERKKLTLEEIDKKYFLESKSLRVTCVLETNKSGQECNEDIVKYFNPSVQEIKEESSDSSNFLIYIIYIVIFISLQSQLTLFFSKCKKKISFSISEFNINAPATLGILGTIISFAILASSSVNGNIQELFLKNFFNAVITTALGVTVYIVNLFLNIYISPRIEER